jgi:HK97 family phage major capsid protein
MTDMKEIKDAFDGYNAEIKKMADELKGNVSAYNEIKAAIGDYTKQNKDLLNAVAEMQTKMAKGQYGGNVNVYDLPEVKSMGNFMRQNVEGKAMTVNYGPSMGYVVPPVLVSQIQMQLRDIDPIRKYANIISITGSLADVPYDDTDAGVEWVGEISTRSATTAPGIGLNQIPVNTEHATIYISRNLLADGVINVEQYVIDRAIDKLSREEGTKFVIGSGSNTPQGVFTSTKLTTINGGSTSAITCDNLIDLKAELPSAVDADAVFIMNKKTAAYIRKLKDTYGQYLWQPAMAAGMPSTFDGQPVVIAPSAPTMASAAIPVVYGRLKDYTIVDRMDLEMLRDEITAKRNNEIEFTFNKRVGGGITQGASFKGLKMSTS